jgi:nucleotide-binding universal stress UspA family protein
MVYKKILVPHDGSSVSDRALESAVSIAKATGAQVMLFNVIQEVIIPAGATDLGYSKRTGEKLTVTTLTKELYQEMRKDAAAMLDQRRQECLKEAENLAIESRIVIGYPPDKITEFIREQGIDLVVMGTRGLQGIAKIATIGSVTRKVSEASSSPVILVQ